MITTTDAEEWTAELTIEELPGAARRVVAVYPADDEGLDDMLVALLAKLLARDWIEAWGCKDGGHSRRGWSLVVFVFEI